MVYTKRKEFAPFGSKFFPFRADPLSEGLDVKKGNRVRKVIALVKKWRKFENELMIRGGFRGVFDSKFPFHREILDTFDEFGIMCLL